MSQGWEGSPRGGRPTRSGSQPAASLLAIWPGKVPIRVRAPSLRRGGGQAPGRLTRDQVPLGPPQVATSFPYSQLELKISPPWVNGPVAPMEGVCGQFWRVPAASGGEHQTCGLTSGARSLRTAARGLWGLPQYFCPKRLLPQSPASSIDYGRRLLRGKGPGRGC